MSEYCASVLLIHCKQCIFNNPTSHGHKEELIMRFFMCDIIIIIHVPCCRQIACKFGNLAKNVCIPLRCDIGMQFIFEIMCWIEDFVQGRMFLMAYVLE